MSDNFNDFSNGATDLDGGITVSLTLDDDQELECKVLTIFTVEESDYIALLPINENGEQIGEDVYLYGYDEDENGTPVILNIESEEEYNKATDEFVRIMEEAENAEE
ncbi:Protein of unknown function [Acetitomaculum ruminis DSM 5522]|uniref:Uncharacterized protein n=1 Tax=Acetitomaculum ruminis DSM 5522 TaxID=1120918 RepID=A0A1I0VLK9_9FIRM|nr:DUF1292 domain-containing protein [Acetitomaculum ruminis]SFA77304.1 Protein of unknown function [Acetitomaculum ruminis DSM 5522]